MDEQELSEKIQKLRSSFVLHDFDIDLSHYTPAVGLKSIIESNSIWLSNSFFLNDAKEVVHLREFVTAFLEKVLESSEYKITKSKHFQEMLETIYEWAIDYYKSRLFVLSLTDEEDSLPLWLGYARNDGYNIRLNLQQLLDLSSGPKTKSEMPWVKASNPISLRTGITVGKVIYEDSFKEDIVHKFLNLFLEEFSQIKDWPITQAEIPNRLASIILALADFAYLSKDRTFAPEREYRILFAAQDKETDAAIRQFRLRNGVFVPYTALSFASTTGATPFTGIMIGPRRNKELAELGLRYFLNHHTLGFLEIRHSKLPLRE